MATDTVAPEIAGILGKDQSNVSRGIKSVAEDVRAGKRVLKWEEKKIVENQLR